MEWKWVSPTSLLPSSLQFVLATPLSLHRVNSDDCSHMLSEHIMPHCSVCSGQYRMDGWPALLDFQTPTGSGSGLTEDLLGKFWLVVKIKRHVHTQTCTQSFLLKWPLWASLSFPPTLSTLLTLYVAETTYILFNWIFWGRAFSMFSRHFRAVGVTAYIMP